MKVPTTLAIALSAGLVSCGSDESGPGGPSFQMELGVGVDSQVHAAGGQVSNTPFIRVFDDAGNPVAGVPVHFEVTAGGGTVLGANAVSEPGGEASALGWQLGVSAGRNALRITVDNRVSTSVVAFGVSEGVAVGPNHSCGLTIGGAAYCWGQGINGELGNGGNLIQKTPTAVSGGLAFISISAGDEHSCAVARDGGAWCWGDNSAGQLGANTKVPALDPVAVVGNTRFTTVTVGAAHTCGLALDGLAWCWGTNADGEIGDNTHTERLVPTRVAGNRKFVELKVGTYHTCGRTAMGETFCWGFNGSGETGGTNGNGEDLVPVRAASGLTFTAIAAGASHSCGIRQDGVYCWGGNQSGQLGDSTTVSTALPHRVVTSVALPFVALAGGIRHTCGLISDGKAFCWGNNFDGQLGDNTNNDRLTPVNVAGGNSFTAIASKGRHNCAIVEFSGAAFCWGGNDAGQLGNNSTTKSPVPVPVSGGLVFLRREE